MIANPSANDAIKSKANLIATNSAWYNGDDTVVITKSAAGGGSAVVVDSLGKLLQDPGTEWGINEVSTADNTLRRKSSVVSGDTDITNAFDPAVEWEGFATDTISGLGCHTGELKGVHACIHACTIPYLD